MLSDIPKQFDRNYLIGFFIPSFFLIFGTATILLVSFEIEYGEIQNILVNTKINSGVLIKYFGISLTVILLISLLTSVLLNTFNSLIIRFLEGYYCPVKWFQVFAVKDYEKSTNAIKQVKSRYLNEMKKGDVSLETQNKYAILLREHANKYPPRAEHILATQFGNVLRSAETYSQKMYGADIIQIWPRLIAVMDKQFLQVIEETKSSVDFSVNMMFVCFLLVIEICLLVIKFHTCIMLIILFSTFILLFLGCIFSYHLAVKAASDWGQYIRSASDLYLDDLLEKMRIIPPTNLKKRKQLWEDLSRSFLFLDEFPEMDRYVRSISNSCDKS